MNDNIVIADILEDTRRLTLYFIKQLDPEQASQRFSAAGYALNSAAWLMGHLVWAEDALTMRALGHKGMGYPWLKYFDFNADGSLPADAPGFKELYNALRETHEASQAFLRNLDPATLDEASTGELASYWDSKRKILYHAIRHEGQHSGHISWLVKLHQQSKANA